jgi:hypothetical protein
LESPAQYFQRLAERVITAELDFWRTKGRTEEMPSRKSCFLPGHTAGVYQMVMDKHGFSQPAGVGFWLHFGSAATLTR